MTVLVIAEHDNVSLKSETAKVIAAAASLAGDIDVLVAGSACAAVAESVAKLQGVSRVLVADNPVYKAQLADNLAKLVVGHASGYSHIFAAATSTGKDLLPRVAALLDVAMISEVVKIEDADTFVHPIYAGNALEKVKSLDAVKVATVRASAFDAVPATANAAIVALDVVINSVCSELAHTTVASERPELGNARVIVSGGRALGSADNFAMLERLADKLGGAVGASRAAVDAGYISNDLQVGQTGKIVAPELYIAVGISGAIQHLAGMKDSKVIVAINKDPQAPIFQVADYGLEADLFEAVPKLVELI
ncbi:electron transfer flavoprotein subunit alpha/FixB family protein [Shewanella sp.]|jgi:electron transfer flavoprotein alpha subunit|uniref:electron transfer flavoprotein subunit alpha/FixB family protein n=1 Tax=Shewanella sp. TaxID=50422 RepID=UPI003D114EE7